MEGDTIPINISFLSKLEELEEKLNNWKKYIELKKKKKVEQIKC